MFVSVSVVTLYSQGHFGQMFLSTDRSKPKVRYQTTEDFIVYLFIHSVCYNQSPFTTHVLIISFTLSVTEPPQKKSHMSNFPGELLLL